MFARFPSSTFLIAAAAAALLVRADVTPSDPGPGVVYQVGGTCHIGWIGDTTSTTAWKSMSIQLMTGDNFNMIALETVATNLDGTVTGTFDHPCPNVTPNSVIYFYQFTAPGASDKQWTTRFTIASSTGATTPPTNNLQPDGQNVAWGTGVLVGSGSDNSSTTALVTEPTTAGTSTIPSPIASTGTTTPLLVTVTTSKMTYAPSTTPVTKSNGTNSNSTTSSSSGSNAATGLVAIDAHIWTAVIALGVSTLAFTVFL